MIFDFGGNFLTGEKVVDGQIGVILEEGTEEEITDKQTEELKKVFNIKIETNKEEFMYSPNNTTGRKFQEVWGKDSKNWIGKKFKMNLVKQNVFGKVKDVIYGEPIVEDALTE